MAKKFSPSAGALAELESLWPLVEAFQRLYVRSMPRG